MYLNAFTPRISLLISNAEAIRQLADVAGTSDAVDVLCLCLDVADNDGIGEEEEKQLKKIAQALAVLLFLVVAIDFTSKMLSILADGVLVAGVIALLWPLIQSSE